MIPYQLIQRIMRQLTSDVICAMSTRYPELTNTDLETIVECSTIDVEDGYIWFRIKINEFGSYRFGYDYCKNTEQTYESVALRFVQKLNIQNRPVRTWDNILLLANQLCG